MLDLINFPISLTRSSGGNNYTERPQGNTFIHLFKKKKKTTYTSSVFLNPGHGEPAQCAQVQPGVKLFD